MKGCLPLRLQCTLSLETQGEVVSQTHPPFFFFFLNQREIARGSENSWEAKVEATINPESTINFIDLYYLLKTNIIFVYCMKIWKYQICRKKCRGNQCVSLTWGHVCLFLTRRCQGVVFRKQLTHLHWHMSFERLRLASQTTGNSKQVHAGLGNGCHIRIAAGHSDMIHFYYKMHPNFRDANIRKRVCFRVDKIQSCFLIEK